jgi:hypothetical protein
MSRPELIQQTIDLATQPIPPELWEEVNALPDLLPEDPELNRYK